MVSRRELCEWLWPDLNPNQRDRLLTGAASDARRVLAASEPDQVWIETRYGVGYRFSGDVVVEDLSEAEDAGGRGTPGQGLGRAICQLRDPPANFVGRQRELSELSSQIGAGARILLLAGMGGVGKSALAAALAGPQAESFPDGQLFVNLRGSLEPLEPERAMLQMLRALRRAPPCDLDDAEIRNAYYTELRGRRLLLLLDDAEDCGQVEPLLPPGGETLVLVTSRRRFGLQGVTPYPVEPLQPKEAARLVESVAPLAKEVALEVAHLCGHLPLALVLASTALDQPDVDAEEYVAELSVERERLRGIDGEDATRGLEASLEQGFAKLEARLADRLLALSIFRGDFDRRAAASVWATDEAAAARSLRRLRALHWLEHEGRGRWVRYRLHDLVRIFAMTRLEAASRLIAERRHAEHFLALLEQIDAARADQRPVDRDAAGRLDRDLAHIESAFAWCVREAATEPEAADFCIRYAVSGALELRLPARIRRAWLLKSIAHADAASRGVQRAALCERLGTAHRDLGRLEDARRWYLEAEALCALEPGSGATRSRTTAVQTRIAARMGAGTTAYYLGAPLEAVLPLTQSLDEASESGNRGAEAAALRHLGVARYLAGELREAGPLLERSLKLALELGDWVAEARSLVALANLDRALGDGQQACTRGERALALARRVRSAKDSLQAQIGLAFAYTDVRSIDKATVHVGEALELAIKLDDARGQAQAQGAGAVVAYANRELELGLARAQECLDGARKVEDRYLVGWALGTQGVLQARVGQSELAQACFAEWMRLAASIPDRRGRAAAHWLSGMQYVRHGEIARALPALEACVAYEEEMQHPRAAAHRAYILSLEPRATEDRG